MKITLLVVATLAAACVHAQGPAPPPVDKKPRVEIIKQNSDVEVNGYNFDFETSDGTSRQEQGEYKNDTEQQGLLVKGSYKYIAPDGQHIAVTFVADKNGYQPVEQKDDQQKQQPEKPATV